MSAAGSVGLSRGLRIGLDNVRQRRRQAEQDAIAEEERQRRHEREDFSLQRARVGAQREDEAYPGDIQERDYERGRRRVEDVREDLGWQEGRDDRAQARTEHREDRAEAQGDRAHQRARGLVLEGRDDTVFQQGQEDREHDLARGRVLEQRDDVRWGQAQEDRNRERLEGDIDWMREQLAADEARQMAAQEGLRDFATVLKNGGDPDYALRRFNRTGQWRIAPETFHFDRSTGRIAFRDSDGDVFDGTLDELLRTVGSPPDTNEPIKLSRNDRLIRRREDGSGYDTLIDAVPDEGGGGEGEGGGAGGGRKQATYNAESTQNQIANRIGEAFGGVMDLQGRMSIADSGDRRKVTYLSSLGTDMEGRLRQHVMNGTLTIDEIAEAVLAAGGTYKTDSQLEELARSEGYRPGTESARQWVEAERTKQDASVRERLARSEQRLLGKTEQAAGNATVNANAGDIKTVSSQEEYDALPSGKNTPFRTPDGKTYTKP